MAGKKSARKAATSDNDKILEEKFTKLLDSACDQVADSVLPLITKALKQSTQLTKPQLGGFGLRSFDLTQPLKKESELPDTASLNEKQLRASISMACGLGFGFIMSGILKDPELQNYWIRQTASKAGKRGGRPKKRMPHIEWLEERLRYQMRTGCDDYTATEHFDEVRHASEIDGEDDAGNLRFLATWLESKGWHEGMKEPAITLNAVQEALARIRKTL